MKNTFVYYSTITLFFLMSCNSNDDHHIGNNNPPITGGNNPTVTNFEYEIKILFPNSIDKNINETIPIQIEFKSNTGKVVHL